MAISKEQRLACHLDFDLACPMESSLVEQMDWNLVTVIEPKASSLVFDSAFLMEGHLVTRTVSTMVISKEQHLDFGLDFGLAYLKV